MSGKIYRAIETPITFQDSGGSAVITLQNLPANYLRISAQYDRGAGSLPAKYQWRAVLRWASTPVVAKWAEIYLAQSDGTYVDGSVGTSDSYIGTEEQLRNLLWLGNVVVQSATTGNMIASGECTIVDRYISVGIANRGNVALFNTANVSKIILTPVPDEIQV